MWKVKLRMRRDPMSALIRNKSTRYALLIAACVLLSVPANAQTAHKASKLAKAPVQALPAPAAVLEPKAIEILKAACAKLAAAHSMSFTAVISYENPSRLGPPLIYTVRDDVTLQRPDKLKVITPGDGPVNEFYYDGKRCPLFYRRRTWSQWPAPRLRSTRC